MRNSVRYYVLRILKFLAEDILPPIFWVLLIFGFDTPDVAVLTILAALLHELGHMAVIAAMKRGWRLGGHVSGFRIHARGGGYLNDIISRAAGPATNLAVFLLTIPFSGLASGYVSLVGYINLITALSNLLPIEGYDGYGIIKALLMVTECQCGVRVLERVSFSLSVILTFLSLYLLLRYGTGYWIFGIFFIGSITKIKQLTEQDDLRE